MMRMDAYAVGGTSGPSLREGGKYHATSCGNHRMQCDVHSHQPGLGAAAYPDRPTPAATESGNGRVRCCTAAGDWLASTLIGRTVTNAQGETLGDINDLIVDEQGTVVAVVIGVGGFLGMGEKDVGVRYSALQFQPRPEPGAGAATGARPGAAAEPHPSSASAGAEGQATSRPTGRPQAPRQGDCAGGEQGATRSSPAVQATGRKAGVKKLVPPRYCQPFCVNDFCG